MSTSLPLIMRSSWGFAYELAVRAAHAAGELVAAVVHLVS
jgi:hypothetical protein